MMKRILTVLICMIACSSLHVQADGRYDFIEGDTSRVYDLDEVIVVSQPKETLRLRQQALSSSMFSQDELQYLGVRDLRELSNYTPSFVMPSYGSRVTSSMYIRGIGARINNPSVGMYVDGLPLTSKNFYNFHTYQLERVDVLRGPQGTLYGMNTEGGLVRLYSKNPMNYQGTDIQLGYGTKNYRNVEFGHYHKSSDRFAFSLAGFYNGQDGFFKNQTTDEDADNYNEAGGKVNLIFQPTDRLMIDVLADYQYVRQNGFPYGVMNLEEGTTADPSTNLQNNYRRNMLTSGIKLRYSGDELDFYSTTSYQYLKDYMLMDQDYLPQSYMHLEQRQLQNAFTQEFALKYSGDKWRWTTGVYGSYQWLRTWAPVYFDEAMTGTIASGIRNAMYNAMVNSMAAGMIQGGMPRDVAMARAEQTIESRGGVTMNVLMGAPGLFHTPQGNLAVFHESNIDLTDRLMATIGLRYDYSTAKIEYETNAYMAMTANVMGTEATYTLLSELENKSDNHFGQLLPKIGLTYTLSDNGSNIYATWSKGYRAGGFNMQMFSDILQTELNANSNNAMRGDYTVPHTDRDYENIKNTIVFEPETSWNYEVGTHLNLFNNQLQFDLAAYYMQIRNQQLSVWAGTYGFGRMMVNAGKSYSCGIELSLRGKNMDNHLSWAVNYGITHAAFKEYNDSIDGKQVSYNDKKVPFVPMHTISGMADYRIDLGRTVKALVVGVNMQAMGKTYWDEANTYGQNLYAVLGAHAALDCGNVSVNLWGRNLTGTKYNTFAFDSSASGTHYYFAQRGAPFQMGIDVNIHF